MSRDITPIRKSFHSSGEADFKEFLETYNNYQLYDLYKVLYQDSISVVDPSIYFSPPDQKTKHLNSVYDDHHKLKKDFRHGEWVVIPVLKEIYHLISQQDFLNVRTVRNRNLITTDEQQKLYKQKIVLVGLSVGSNVLTSLVRLGVGNSYTIVDYDTVDSHNINRTQFFLRNIAEPKVISAAKTVWGIDPYLDLRLIQEPLSRQNISTLIQNHDVVIDAFDHFESKIALRNEAKKHKKPVISGWDVGEGTVVIAERYDIDDDVTIGLFLNNVPLEEVTAPTSSLREKIDIFIKIIGKEIHDERMLTSVYSIGSELTGIPQHIIATSLTSAVFCKVVIDIILGKSSSSFRKHLDLNTLIYS